MSQSGRHRPARRNDRRKNQARKQMRRGLWQVERLEERRVLAGNLSLSMQNPSMHEDVNSDGVVTPMDLLVLLGDQQINGVRQLSHSGEGEPGSAGLYLDVNADGYATPADMLGVLNRLMAEGAGPQVQATMSATTVAGAPITSVNVGDHFRVHMTVADIRDPNDPDFPLLAGDSSRLGVFSAYFNIAFPTSVTVATNAFTLNGNPVTFLHGPDYRTLTDTNTPKTPEILPGLIKNLGGVQTSFGGSLGPGTFDLVTMEFIVGSSGLTAVNDGPVMTNEGTPIDVLVLANDTVTSSITIDRQATTDAGREVNVVISGSVNGNQVPDNEIVGAEPTLTVNGVALGGLTVLSTSSGTATVQNNGTPSNGADDFIRYTPGTGFTGNATIVYRIADGVGGTATATATVAVGAFNDPPVNSVPGAQTVNEDQQLTFTGAGKTISISDPDAGTANVQTNLTVTHGILTLATTSGLTVTGNGTGAVQMTGPITAINTALNGLIYLGANNYNGPDTLTIVTNDLGNTGDGGAQSDTDTVAITVTPQNDAPVNSVPGAQTAISGDALPFAGADLISISDVDAGTGLVRTTLTVTTGDGPDAGDLGVTLSGGATIVAGANNTTTLTIQGTVAAVNATLATLTYTPPIDLVGGASLQVLTDDQGNTGAPGPLTDTDTITIDVVPPVLPFAIRDRVTVNEDSINNVVDVLINDRANTGSDPTLLSFVAPPAAQGTLTLVDGGTPADGTDDSFLFTPAGDFNGTVTFTYVINESPTTGGADSTGTVTITVREMNDAPTANPDGPNAQLTTNEDTLLSIPGAVLTANDSKGPANEASQTLTVIGAAVGPEGGMISVAGNVVSFTPPSNFNGTTVITYTVQDNGTTNGANDFKTSVSSATITVNAVNDPPNAVNDPATALPTTLEDTAVTIAPSVVLANDTPGGGADEAGQTLSVTAVSNPTNGTVALVAGQIVFTPASNVNGTGTFVYTVTDNGTPNASSTATATVTITPVNDNPIAGPDSAPGIKGVASTIAVSTLLSNDTPGGGADEAGQILSITGVSATSTQGGTVSLVGGNVIYNPATGFSGTDTFTYTLVDNGSPQGTATGTVTVNVADFIPSSFSGSVFVDSNNNGVRDSGELGLAGVTVTLQRTDAAAAPVVVETDSTGAYTFTTLVPGSYTVTESQPMFMLPGTGHAGNNATKVNNNQFSITIGALGGVDSVGNDFGERGLDPNYFNLEELRATLPSSGGYVATNEAGDQFWCAMLGGSWAGATVEAQISADLKHVTLTVHPSGGAPVQTKSFDLNTDHRVRIMGHDSNGGHVVRIEGTLTELMAAAEAEGEPTDAAADSVRDEIELLANADRRVDHDAVDEFFSMIG